MAYEGDAAEQVSRFVLSGGEIALRMTGSLIKNVVAFLLAMRQNNKVVHGRKSLKKLLGNTRDLRVFPMSKEQFKKFQKLAKPRKLLYAGIGNRKHKQGTVDLMLPMSEIERANQIFETIGFVPKDDRQAVQPRSKRDAVKKKKLGHRACCLHGCWTDNAGNGYGACSRHSPPQRICRIFCK